MIFKLVAEAILLCLIMPTLIVYTQPTCGYCRELKEYLAKNNIPYEERDITKDRAAWDELVNKYKARATPLIVYGDKTLLGFNVDELRKMLGIEQAPAR
ncbi:Glutaredoxin and related protein [Methanocella conradii HZ254]|uniref:Glutaredoxin and related protein n=2 Tax=Methanocella TaxID=570266 RepID=H8I9R1_METCZ|nr:glutaredoxin family protein [Methanocella conradii]AFD00512.1 Glutaredoxin and related protein [Methanocella conradii HZ254]